MERSSMSDVMRQRRNAEASSCVCEAVARRACFRKSWKPLPNRNVQGVWWSQRRRGVKRTGAASQVRTDYKMAVRREVRQALVACPAILEQISRPVFLEKAEQVGIDSGVRRVLLRHGRGEDRRDRLGAAARRCRRRRGWRDGHVCTRGSEMVTGKV